MTTTRRRSPASHARIASPSDADYLAVMSRAVFQAGLSWAAIDRQWEQLVAAFGGFAPPTVGAYGDRDVGRIMAHPGILHSERKILATIHNAQALLAVAQEDISAYYFLFRCGEQVPPFSRWIKTVKGDHPRIREMVQADRQR